MALEPMTRGLWRYRSGAGEPGGPAARTVVVAPYGGGSAYSVYDLLPHLTDAGDETLVLQYPGRGPRIGEPLPGSLHELADQMAAEIDRYATGALVLVGHSLGGLLCFELAHRLTRAGRHVALLVISSAQPTASTTLSAAEISARDVAQWVDVLRAENAITDEVLDNPEMLRLAIQVIRADTLLVAGHVGSPQPLRCPMLVVGGDADPDITAEHLRGWSDLTLGPATTVLLPGDHFYYRDRAAELGDLVRRQLSVGCGTGPVPIGPTQGDDS
ncbi:thioesterase II family protein [Micromonospora echinofusca]|uniref:Alpha/beta fold hydrolase n=1 Tax=Micromonospora echinofusca TaxID=47858 RepID=A0ABS3VYN6_MICEH|nr:alpha/beta fold hydrolase [Micromonospora echinofusca]MBO4209654.1 alpha/beta fold hydrolase [Micromonospora echinofusca]